MMAWPIGGGLKGRTDSSGGAYTPESGAMAGRRRKAAIRVQAQIQVYDRKSSKPKCLYQIVTCVPTSTTRPVGIWKKSVASLADFARAMNRRSCQRGIP